MISDPAYDLNALDKLERFGTPALDYAELLGILIGGPAQVECGRRLVEEYGRLTNLAAAEIGELAQIQGVGRAKAARIAVAFELLTRMAKERMAEASLDSPERIYEYFGPQLAHQPQERVVVATVDSRLRHISTTTISIGTVNECTAHPRDVMRPVITRSAHGFVLIHNHPSGDPSPSRADHAITSRIADVANTMQVRFVDHVIIGKPSSGRLPYFSFRESGQIG